MGFFSREWWWWSGEEVSGRFCFGSFAAAAEAAMEEVRLVS